MEGELNLLFLWQAPISFSYSPSNNRLSLAGFSGSLIILLTGFSGIQQSHSSMLVCIATLIADNSLLIVELVTPALILSSRYFAKSEVFNSDKLCLTIWCLNITFSFERSRCLSFLFSIFSQIYLCNVTLKVVITVSDKTFYK